jgi:hypothetical protein
MNALHCLEKLTSEEFISPIAYVGTPIALYRVLRRSPEILALEQALLTGELSPDNIKDFASSLANEIKKGESFKYDITLAALGVVLERNSSDFAEEYLSDLAKLNLLEIPMSIRVARECIKNRVHLAKTTVLVRETVLPSEALPLREANGANP